MATTTNSHSIARTNQGARLALRSSSSITSPAQVDLRVLKTSLYSKKRTLRDSKRNLKVQKKLYREGFLSKTINSKSVKLKT